MWVSCVSNDIYQTFKLDWFSLTHSERMGIISFLKKLYIFLIDKITEKDTDVDYLEAPIYPN